MKRLNVGLLPGCLVVVVFKDHTAAAAQCRHTDFLAISLAANRNSFVPTRICAACWPATSQQPWEKGSIHADVAQVRADEHSGFEGGKHCSSY